MTMPKCLVPGCQSRYRYRKKSFFKIPGANKNPRKWQQAKKWLQFCQIDISTFRFQPYECICEDHFAPDLFEIKYKNVFPVGPNSFVPKRIKPGAMPTVNPPLSDDKNNNCGESNSVNEIKEEMNQSSFACEQIRAPPKSAVRQQVSDLARWPPNVKISLADLNPLLTCGICRGYFYNAVTITECLHTFCKACLVQHFYRSLNCPTCDVEVHPSDPCSCIKSDSTMQDLVNKIFPEKCEEEMIREIAFYRSRGLKPPNAGSVYAAPNTQIEKPDAPPKLTSILFEYIGTSPHLPKHMPLKKRFILVPDNVTVGQIQAFIRLKLRLAESSQACVFVNLSMLHQDLTIRRVEEIFGDQTRKRSMGLMVLQFGVVPKGDYFQEGIIINTKEI